LSKGRSLAEQETETRAMADRLGLTVVEVFKEREGVGASRRSGKRRPEWERALAALDHGDTFRTLLVWELSRADRRGWAVLDGMVTLLGEKGRRLLGVDGTDLTDPARRLENVIRAEMARQEAENTAARVERAKRADRLAGRWPGGIAPFGLRIGADRRLEPDPETYPTARAIADAILKDATLWSVVQTLNGKARKPINGIPVLARTPEGRMPGERVRRTRAGRDIEVNAAWTVGSVSALLRSPSFAGLATKRARKALADGGQWAAVGNVMVDEEGRPMTVGTGVITEGERDRILRSLTARTRETGDRVSVSDTSRRSIAGVGRRGESLLTGGLGRCQCGASLQVYGMTAKYPQGFLRCGAYANGKGCDTLAQGPRETVERHVLSQVWAALVFARAKGLALWDAVQSAWREAVRVEESEAIRIAREDAGAATSAVERLEDLLADGLLDRAAYARQRARKAEALAAAEARLAELTPDEPVYGDEPWDQIVAWHESGNVADLRRLVSLVVREVILLPAPDRGVDENGQRRSTRGQRFNAAARIEILWREDAAGPGKSPAAQPPSPERTPCPHNERRPTP
jgi:DNA invertase Pin-like site-specific DNA recombinase